MNGSRDSSAEQYESDPNHDLLTAQQWIKNPSIACVKSRSSRPALKNSLPSTTYLSINGNSRSRNDCFSSMALATVLPSVWGPLLGGLLFCGRFPNHSSSCARRSSLRLIMWNRRILYRAIEKARANEVKGAGISRGTVEPCGSY